MEQWMIDLIKYIMPLVITFVSGGFTGGIFTFLITKRDARQKAELKQLAIIEALIGELLLARSICEVNGYTNATVYIHLPTMVATRVAFTERDIYPLLKRYQTDLEQYVLTASSVNESIDMYFRVLPISEKFSGIAGYRKPIEEICFGSKTLHKIESLEIFTLPGLINDLIPKLRQLATKP